MDIPKTIVCLGDSITNNRDQRSYVDFWQELCGDSGRVIAAGVNGETAYEGFYRLKSDVFPHHPNLVTVMYGHNDLNQSIQPRAYLFHLEKIVTECRKQMIDQIWLLSPNQVADPLIASAYQFYLQGLPKLAKSLKIRFVDLWSLFDDQNLKDFYDIDYLHPNERGHRLMADKLMVELHARIK